jgi:hypothetical protein
MAVVFISGRRTLVASGCGDRDIGCRDPVPFPDAVFHLIRTLGPENFHISFVTFVTFV